MVKVWILIIMSAIPPNVPVKIQEVPMFSRETCLATMERLDLAFNAAADNGFVGRARCISRNIQKPKEKK